MSLAIKDDGVAEINVAGGSAALDSHITMDDTWQNFIIVWRNSDGLLRLFKNGGNKESEKASEGKKVKTGGTMYLGQKHKDDGFDKTKLMRGSIADFEIWSNWITDGTAIKIYNYNCQTAANFIPGDILSWDKILKSAIKGKAERICPSTCKKP
ncbi:neuronal pentraxin-2 [Exaiptasia diaphana]|uniref:Pentraxin (PTX) domain-containing protein n=1 Tax=Exaiptasia diaphana TaxID=2652724 RepID=A0A913YUQ3_EXADI|nr:neuronal pentraxin-2 [Exaiptasia diaphana]